MSSSISHAVAEPYSEHELRDFRDNQSKAWNPMYNGHRWLATIDARDADVSILRSACMFALGHLEETAPDSSAVHVLRKALDAARSRTP